MKLNELHQDLIISAKKDRLKHEIGQKLFTKVYFVKCK